MVPSDSGRAPFFLGWICGGLLLFLGCKSTPSPSLGTPELAFAELQSRLRLHADAAVFELLAKSTQDSLSLAVEDPNSGPHWQSLALRRDELLRLPAAHAFARILNADRIRRGEEYRLLTEGKVSRVEAAQSASGPRRAVLRCYHPESDSVRLLIFQQEGPEWRLVDLL